MCRLQDYKPRNKKPYIVTYDDGEQEPVDLAEEKWQLLQQPKKSDSAPAAAGKASKGAAADKPAAKAASKAAEKPSSKKAADKPAEADSKAAAKGGKAERGKAAAVAEKGEAEQQQSEEQEEEEEQAEPAKQQKKKPAAKEKPAAKKAAAAKSGGGSSAAAAAGGGSSAAAAAGLGAELVGKRVKMWWPGEKAWFEGKVTVSTTLTVGLCGQRTACGRLHPHTRQHFSPSSNTLNLCSTAQGVCVGVVLRPSTTLLLIWAAILQRTHFS